MEVKNITVNRLYKITKRKPMICFGAGEVFLEMFRKSKPLQLEKNVKYVIDNDISKWNKAIEVGDTRIPVMSIEVLKDIEINEYTLVITAKKYEEIHAQIKNCVCDRKIKIYIYPSYRDFACKVFKSIVKILPIKNYILLQGEGDTCENAKAIGKYIREHNYFDKYKLIWLCDFDKGEKDIIKEKYILRSIHMQEKRYLEKWRYFYYKACAKYLMFENEIIEKEKDGQVSVYMNHGSPPLKATLGHIVLPSNIDYVVCPSENVADIVSEQYSVSKEKLIYCGSPRTDVFFRDEKNIELYKALEIDKYRKVILWAPTFRAMNKKNRVDSIVEYPYGLPVIYSEMDYNRLVNSLHSKGILLIVKPHIYQDMSKWNLVTDNNIKIVTQSTLDECKSNVYDLMVMSDGLITDYSTIAFDYMLLDRMIGYTIDDMDKYTIGFSVKNPLDYMPGYKICNIDEFVEYIEAVSVDDDKYKEARHKVENYVHIDKGESSRKLLTIVGVVL